MCIRDRCQQFEVRGYPTLLLFPTEVIENGEGASQKNYYKFAGARTLESLKSFALEGDWVNAEAETIPKNVEGVEYWKAFAKRTLRDMARDIDLAVAQMQLETYLPKPYRYIIASSVFVLPVLLICVLLCCCTDDYGEYPEAAPVKPKKVQLTQQ